MADTKKTKKKQEPAIDREVFDKFFRESYCSVEYSAVRDDFEAVADRGLEEFFTDDTDISAITGDNFILYMRGETYSELEEIVSDAMDTLNTEILDAVMDVSTTMDDADDITGSYWDTTDQLLKRFLKQLYAEKIAGMIREC